MSASKQLSQDEETKDQRSLFSRIFGCCSSQREDRSTTLHLGDINLSIPANIPLKTHTFNASKLKERFVTELIGKREELSSRDFRQKLDVDWRSFSGDINQAMQSFTDNLDNLPSLEELSLDFNETALNEIGSYMISKLLEKATNLKYLTLILNPSIDDKGLQELTKGIAKLLKLTNFVLNISKNVTITDRGCSLVAEAISGLPKISHITISLYNCKQVGDATCTKLIGHSPSIQSLELDLGGTSITDKTIVALTDAIKRLPAVKKIDLGLDNTDVTDIELPNLAEVVSGKLSLVEFNLVLRGCYGVSDKGCEQIVTSFKNRNKPLSLQINIEKTGITKEGKKAIESQSSEIHRHIKLNLFY